MKYLTIFLLLFSLGTLSAEHYIYPTTTLVENFGATWCGACAFALAGLSVLESDTNNSEMVVARLLTESGDYSNAAIDSRFAYYDVIGLPAAIFNGKTRVDGSGDDIADGSLYHTALNRSRYLGSPLKLQMPLFNAVTGNISVSVELLNPELEIASASLVYYLVEEDVDTELTHILRDLQVQEIALNYTGTAVPYSVNFDIDPSWDLNKLWALAFVQTPNKSILQTVSSLPLPQYHVQAALPFDTMMQGEANTQHISAAFLIYNLGDSDSYTRQIEVVSAPDDWYFNYCDEAGNCYPGSMAIPFDLASGAAVAFDLNLSIGSPGTGIFNFVVNSAHLGSYKIPFEYRVGTSNDDLVAPVELLHISSYPNPFRSELIFELTSHKAGLSSSIEIFNIRGQKVTSIAVDQLKQGLNSITWTASSLPNGIYFYKLAGHSKTHKVLKVR